MKRAIQHPRNDASMHNNYKFSLGATVDWKGALEELLYAVEGVLVSCAYMLLW